MNSDVLLRAVSGACRDLVRDAVSGISACSRYEDAMLIAFMQTHQLLGVRRLMLPLAAELGVTVPAESVFDRYLSQLEDVKSGSRSLLQVDYGNSKHTIGPASPAPL